MGPLEASEAPLTEEELVAQLEALARRWPKSHWLFVGEGGINIMRCDKDGKHSMNRWGGVDNAYLVDSIIDIPCDGGGW